jgi:cell division protein FtsB
MRNSKVLVAAGSVRTGGLSMRHVITSAVFLVVAIWVGYAFAQEAYLSHKLLQQASDLRHQNSVLAAQNQGYHKDVQAITSGAANEEEARLNGYSKPNERTFLVTTPPSPTPTPSGTPPASPSPSSTPTPKH